MFKVKFVWLAVVAVLSLVLAGCGGLAGNPEIVSTLPPRPTQAAVQVSAPEQTPSVALGASIFAENCIACHGSSGQGNGELVLSGQVTAPPDFTLPEANDGVTPMDRFSVITNGRMEKLMPPWAGVLTEYERWSVAMYVYALSYTMEELVQGEAIFAAECSECHGSDGSGTAEGASLLGLWDKSDGMLMTQIAQGSGEDMPAFADTLSAEDRAAVVAFVRSLSLSAEAPPLVADTQAGTDTQTDAQNPDAAIGGGETNVIGTIQGSIVHGTDGGVLPGEMEVRLHIFDDNMTETVMRTTTDTEGRFAFEDLLVNSNLVFIASVEYQNGTFISDFQRGSSSATSIDLPVTIYDLAYDPSVLTIGSLVSQVFTFADQLQVVEIIELYNNSDRIYMGTEADDDTGDQRRTVTFTLPENATYLSVSGEERYTLSEDGRQIIDSLPVLPGEPHRVHLIYSIPKTDERVEIRQVLDYPLEGHLEVHVEQGAATVEGAALTASGSFTASGATLDAYGGALTVPAGSTLEFAVIGGRQTSTSSSGGDRSLLAGVLMGIGLVMLVGSGFLFWRSRRGSAAPVAVSTPDLDPVDDLMQQMAALDVLYEEGKIQEKAYRKKRDRLKQRVTELMQKRD
jgi:mono/diheme cytochrome c family protein